MTPREEYALMVATQKRRLTAWPRCDVCWWPMNPALHARGDGCHPCCWTSRGRG